MDSDSETSKSLYRLIRPVPVPKISPIPSETPSTVSPTSPPPPTKRRAVAAACEQCRRRKQKCTAERPACYLCARSGAQCVYRTSEGETRFQAQKRRAQALETENDKYKRLYERLKSLSPDEGTTLLERIQAGDDVGDMLQAIEEGDLLLQLAGPSDIHHQSKLPSAVCDGTIREIGGFDFEKSFMPPTQTSFEFELMMRHPSAYPTSVALDIPQLDLELLLRPNHQCLTKPTTAPTLSETLPPLNSCSSSSHLEKDGRDAHKIPKLIPTTKATATFCDPRLAQLNIQAWTKIPIANTLAAKLISTHLERDHSCLPTFDVDLFLDGLIYQTRDHCSSLLVNAILSWACQAYGEVEPNLALHTYCRAFYSEAERIWKSEAQTVDLPTTAAMVLLAIGGVTQGDADAGTRYMKAGIKLGQQLGLFGVATRAESAWSWIDRSETWIRAASHTAWGCFVYWVNWSIHWRFCCIEHPPMLPIPGRGSYRSSDGVTYVLPLPIFLDSSFPYQCELMLVAHEIALCYFGTDPNAPFRRPTLTEAEYLYRRLLAWADSLPLKMARGDQTSRDTILMHEFMHCLVITIFHPFIQQEQGNANHVKLRTFSSSQRTPLAAYSASVNQLKRLVLAYRTRFEAHHNTIMCTTAMIFLSFAVCRLINADLESCDEPERRFYFYVCTTAFHNLHVSFRMYRVVIQGILAIGLAGGAVSKDDVRAVQRRLRQTDKGHESSADVVLSFVLDYDLALQQDRAAASVDSVARQLDNLAL